jgi:hypothetical protein
VFSKPLEKLMYCSLIWFLKKHNILTSEQRGFMESKSTETASHSFLQSVQESLDKHLHAVGIFLELSKAYDVINHNRLYYVFFWVFPRRLIVVCRRFGTLYRFHLQGAGCRVLYIQPLKMEPIEGSETSAYNNQIIDSKHGESLKSRT